MVAEPDDMGDPDFDDMGPEHWEQQFDIPEWDGPLHGNDEDLDEPDEPEFEDECDGLDGDLDPDAPVESLVGPGVPWVVKISHHMWEAATESGGPMAQSYRGKNAFGSDPEEVKQRRGALGEMAYAQIALGDWRKQKLVQRFVVDFGLVDVKSSKLAAHRDITRMSLIESESRPGIDPVKHPLYVLVVIDDDSRLAHVVGWCTGDELWSEGRSLIPRGDGRMGYLRLASKLRPMSTLLQKWDEIEDGRTTEFRPVHLGS